MEVSDVRRRLRGAIEEAKRRAAERRAKSDEAVRAWQAVLPEVAVPACHTMASALAGEGYRFKVLTPGDSVRLSLERSAEEFVELALDTTRDAPAVMIRSTRSRGRRMLTSERVARDAGSIAALTQDDIVDLLLGELVAFIER